MRIERLFVALILLTVVLIYLSDAILHNVITISPNSHQRYELYNDSINGGNTQAHVLDDKEYYQWQCLLKKGKTNYPYCGFAIELGESLSQGINLSNYNNIKL